MSETTHPQIKITFQELMERYPQSVAIMNDWSGGQFYILEPQYIPSRVYLEDLLGYANEALTKYRDKLTPDGLWVAEKLQREIPPVLTRLSPKATLPTSTSKSPKAGYVYLIQSPTQAYKIGRTVNPDNRMRTFAVKLPFEVEYICLIATNDMKQLEFDLHKMFDSKRIRGEWFALNTDDVEYIKGLAS